MSNDGGKWGRLQTIAQIILFGVILYLIWVRIFRRPQDTAMGQVDTGAMFSHVGVRDARGGTPPIDIV